MPPQEENFPQHGLVVADDDGNLDTMGEFAHAILDDVAYTILFDLVLQTHRNEKMLRAASAAILVEKTAAQSDPNTNDSSSSTDKIPHNIETDTAIYNSGEVYLKGNPLKTLPEILCGKCNLPRLLYPTEGVGARKPEPGVEYCKKRPFIEKPYHDVYGQTFQPDGPGRGKKKKDMFDPLKNATPGGSLDGESPPSEGGPVKPIAFPHAKCQNCNAFLPIKRMNNHMVKCIGGGGRDSSRAALKRIQNGNGNGSQNGNTPAGSRNTTPAPSNSSKDKSRSGSKKRDAEDDFDDEASPPKKAKKKPAAAPKKSAAPKLKAPSMVKNGSQQREASNLSFEEKAPASESGGEHTVDDDDDEDGDYGTVVVDPKKKKTPAKKTIVKKTPPPKEVNIKKLIQEKKKWVHKKGSVKMEFPPPLPPIDYSMSRLEIEEQKKRNAALSAAAEAAYNARKSVANSPDTSQTLSSPN